MSTMSVDDEIGTVVTLCRKYYYILHIIDDDANVLVDKEIFGKILDFFIAW